MPGIKVLDATWRKVDQVKCHSDQNKRDHVVAKGVWEIAKTITIGCVVLLTCTFTEIYLLMSTECVWSNLSGIQIFAGNRNENGMYLYVC